MAQGAGPLEGPHLRIEHLAQSTPYRRPPQLITRRFVRDDHARHADDLLYQLELAYRAARERPDLRDPAISIGQRGIILAVEGLPKQSLETLELRSRGIRLAALQTSETGGERAAVFLPDHARDELERRLEDYRNSGGANRPNATHARFEPVERVHLGDAETYWTSQSPFPDRDRHWFEVWCLRPLANQVGAIAERLGLHRSNESLKFPDLEVLFLHGSPEQLRRLVWNAPTAIFQLRLGMDHPRVFARSDPRAQHDWIADARRRLILPSLDAPSVAVLDFGVTRGHPLLDPLIAPEDTFAYEPEWLPDDHDRHGHGTNMAGAAIYGDLTFTLASTDPIVVRHRLESMKILPAAGSNSPNSYGVVTQGSVATLEYHRPERRRILCCAVTSDAHSSFRPTTWSAAIDQICSGSCPGDEGVEAIDKPKRPFLIAAGNVRVFG